MPSKNPSSTAPSPAPSNLMLFNNKYRIESARLRTWDYSTPGFYFITICTDNRQHFFGTIAGGRMILSETGKIAETNWSAIPNQFPFAKTEQFVIMPDHIHGIIQITDSAGHAGHGDSAGFRRDAINRVSTGPGPGTGTETETDKTGGVTGKHNPMMNPRSLSAIIRWFKGRTSFMINKLSTTNAFKWQPRFHDHIIRNHDELIRIRNYIINNPMNWDSDSTQCPHKKSVGSILEHTMKE